MQTKLLFYASLWYLLSGIAQVPVNKGSEFTLCNPNKIYAVDDYLYDTYFKSYEKTGTNPMIVGGKDSLTAYFTRSVKLTGEETQLMARYHIIFVVNCKGDLGLFELKSKNFPGADKILEACKHMPKWIPATKNNANVDCYVRLGFTNLEGKLIVSYKQ